VPRCPVCRRRLEASARCPEDGGIAGPSPAPPPREPPAIPGYAVEAFLGRGGFADVWAAGDGAIKVGRTATAAAIERIEREADVLADLGSPAAPALIDRGRLGTGQPYLIMERIAGEPFADVLAAAAPAATARAAAIGEGLFAALARVHRGGWIHGDLKPENLRLAGEQVRILDFGLAVRPGAIGGAGTPEYASPEQLRGEPLSPASDVWAAGLILYELLAGGPAFPDAYAALALRPPPLESRVEVPGAAAAIALACLRKDPAGRPEAAAAARAWREALAGAGPLRRRAAPRADDRGRPVLAALVRTAVPERPGAWLAALSAAGGVPVRLEAAAAIAGFVAEPGARPIEAALAWARDRGGGVAHLAAAELIDRAGRPPLLASDACLAGAAWIELAPPPGEIWATAAAGGALGARATEPTGEGGVVRLIPGGRPPPLCGRDGDLEAALAALDGGGLLLFLAAAGLGKSRLAAELADRTGLVVAAAGDLEPAAVAASRVVIVDELERASDELLDAVETAAIEGRLAAVVFARPTLEARRPRWAARCESFARRRLAPLESADSCRLAAALLPEIEYPPRQVLERLASIAAGSPGALVEIVAAIRAAKMIHRDQLGRDRLELAALDGAAALPVARWLAELERGRLPRDRAALLAAVAAGPEELERGEVAAIAAALDLDADVEAGLDALAADGLIACRGERVAVASPLLRRGLAESEPGERRAAAGRAGLAYWSERPLDAEAAAAIAHHGAAAGEPGRAAAAALAAALDAARAHRHLEAERGFGRAIELADSYAARLGRGTIRYRIDRAADALVDLERAAELAAGDGERFATLLEQSTALDWLGRYRDSAARAETAAPFATSAADAARLAMARGRAELRAGHPGEAAALLTEGAEGAAAAGDHDTRVISLLLLGPALVQLGQLDAAEERFAEVIERCAAAGDRIHLGAAYGNRVILSSALGRSGEALADLERARAIARDLGHAVPERNTTYNLALYLYRAGGRDREALELARRARWLQERFVGPALEDCLLCARIALSLGELEAAAGELEAARAVDGERWSAPLEIIAEMIELVAAGDGERRRWRQLAARAEAALRGSDRVEVCYWRLRCTGEAAGDLAAAAAGQPIWRDRIAALERGSPPR
jgi:tetratricopeptide (TPR) repeat protein